MGDGCALTLILTGLMLLAAVVILGMNSPDFLSPWLLCWFAAMVIAVGTIVLFAALGTLGQLIALLVFVYLALASSGGTVPLEGLPGSFVSSPTLSRYGRSWSESERFCTSTGVGMPA